MAEQLDTRAEATKDEESEGKFWAAQIEAASKAERDWRKDSERIQERYRNEKRRQKSTLPIFWSNVQVLKPAVYSATPRPDVRRRTIHENPIIKEIGRQAAIVVENGLRFEIDNATFNAAMESARDDMLIVGRGVVREVYEFDQVRRTPELVPPPVDMMTGAPMGPPSFVLDGQPVQPDGFEDEEALAGPYVDSIENERTTTRYVFWADFRMGDCRCWSECPWVAFRHAMDKDELKAEFGEEHAKAVPMQITAYRPKGQGGAKADASMPPDPESPFSRAEVWEIWSKATKERIWIATGYEDHVLRKDPDPLRLEGFFPMPAPLYAVPTTDTMVPMPELQIYESLADELDEVQERLRRLTKQAKAVNIVDGDFIEIHAISAATDGDNIPTRRQEVVAADLRGSIYEWPVDRVVAAISLLTARSQALRQDIYELTGISDLRRGIGQERESATAQKLKASYGSVRMTPRSKPMAEFVRDLLRIKAEIMAEHFAPESLARISGSAVPPPVHQILQTEKFRNTMIDIETDSTVAADEEQDKADANEFVTGMVGYLKEAVQIAAAAPPMLPLLMEMLKAVARPFKFGRQFEQTIDATADALGAMVAQQAAMGGMMGAAPPPAGNGAMPPGMMQ